MRVPLELFADRWGSGVARLGCWPTVLMAVVGRFHFRIFRRTLAAQSARSDTTQEIDHVY